jgi:hypothetical protein
MTGKHITEHPHDIGLLNPCQNKSIHAATRMNIMMTTSLQDYIYEEVKKKKEAKHYEVRK